MPRFVESLRTFLATVSQGMYENDAPREFDPSRSPYLRSELLACRDEFLWVTVTRGLYKTKKRLAAELEKAKVKYTPSSLEYPQVEIAKERCDVDLTVCTPSGLRFTEEPSLREIYERAQLFGLELCSPEVAVLLRLTYRKQPVPECLYVAMEPISSDVPGMETPYPFIFAVSHTNRHDPILLEDCWALGETKRYPLDARFVFVLPRGEQT